MEWLNKNSYIAGYAKSNNLITLDLPVKIAGLDLDDTLMHVVGKRYDFKFELLDKIIPDKIAELIHEGYLIIIFTNQGGMSRSKTFDLVNWKKSIDKLTGMLLSKVKPKDRHYLAIYAAKGYDSFRKPVTGLWQLMKEDLKEEFKIDKLTISNKSFYVGDASGRSKPSYYKKIFSPTSKVGDHSDTDRKFALNIGIKFMTPEQYYRDAKEEPYELSGFNPFEFELPKKVKKIKFTPREKEMIILIGYPGSGKSTYLKNVLVPAGYKVVCQDKCGSKKKCTDLTESFLEKNKNVVIDALNYDLASRKMYIDLAKEYKYKHIRCIIMDTDIEFAKHMNYTRHVYSRAKLVPEIVYNMYKKRYVDPKKKEGFDLIEYQDYIFDNSMLEDRDFYKAFYKFY